MDRGEKQTRRMRNVLFCIFLLFFVVIVAGTIAMVFLDFGKPTPEERAEMVGEFHFLKEPYVYGTIKFNRT